MTLIQIGYAWNQMLIDTLRSLYNNNKKDSCFCPYNLDWYSYTYMRLVLFNLLERSFYDKLLYWVVVFVISLGGIFHHFFYLSVFEIVCLNAELSLSLCVKVRAKVCRRYCHTLHQTDGNTRHISRWWKPSPDIWADGWNHHQTYERMVGTITRHMSRWWEPSPVIWAGGGNHHKTWAGGGNHHKTYEQMVWIITRHMDRWWEPSPVVG